MLFNAIFLAALKAGGAIAIWAKLPPRLQAFMKKHALLTDISLAVLVYTLLGGTLTALVAGAELGLICSVLLHVANNKQKYNGLIAAGEWSKHKASEMLSNINRHLNATFSGKLIDSEDTLGVVQQAA